MALRTLYSIILIALSIVAPFVWKFWEGQMYNLNFWIVLNYPLNIQWVLKFFGEHVRDVALSMALYNASKKIHALRVIAIVNLVYSVVDLGLFFWSFNRGKDVLLYHWIVTGVVSLIILFKDAFQRAWEAERNRGTYPNIKANLLLFGCIFFSILSVMFLSEKRFEYSLASLTTTALIFFLMRKTIKLKT